MIAIIECGANYNSIIFALARLKLSAEVTTDPDKIRQAKVVILPGVGNAKNAMEKILELKLIDLLRSLTQPVLGICLGMQLLYECSEEGDTRCLGIIPGKIKRLQNTPTQNVPHMGWNLLKFTENENSRFQNNINSKQNIESPYVYFVHSYAAPISAYTQAYTEYTEKFTAIVQYKNFTGMQFHPERSGKIGEKLFINYFEEIEELNNVETDPRN